MSIILRRGTFLLFTSLYVLSMLVAIWRSPKIPWFKDVHLFHHDGQSLVFERVGKVNDLSSFVVNSERSHSQVSFPIDQFTNHTCPHLCTSQMTPHGALCTPVFEVHWVEGFLKYHIWFL